MDSRLRIALIIAALGLGAYWFFFKKGGDTAPPALSAQQTPPSPTARGAPEQVLFMRSGDLDMRVSTYSGASPDMYLRGAQFTDQHTHAPMRFSTTDVHQEPFFSLRSNMVFERNGQNVLPEYLSFTPVTATTAETELVATPPGTDLEIRRTFKAHTNYAVRVRTRVINHGAPGRLRFSQGTYHWVRRDQESGKMFRQSWELSEGVCRDGNRDKLYRESRDDLSKRGPLTDALTRHAEFVGVGNLYFISALVPQGNEPAACHMRAEDRGHDEPGQGWVVTGSIYSAQLSWQPVELGTNESHDYAIIGYFGPKLRSSLTAASPFLDEAVNLGFFAIIARWLLKLLQFLHAMCGNWGLSIILLTVIVRTALYPILARTTKSMAVMQRLKPEIDAINTKFADNQEQKGLATMELYRKHGVNPVAGCLPQFAQLPVWWALYTTLQTSVELFHAPFILWWHDLSAPDPYYVLPLVLGAVMFLQQKLMPPAMPDPVQAKIMLYAMPLFLTGISLFLPAGLALYMLVNSCLAILQQKITKAQIEKLALQANGGIEVRAVEATLPTGDSSGGGNKSGGGRGKRR